MILTFPFKGQHRGGLPSEQPAQTSPLLQNCRAFWQGRLRGGQRPGLRKWSSTQIGGAEQPVVALTSVTVTESL
jgi:hypothetical protein